MLLAKNKTTTWSLVFDRKDASLFVERTVDGATNRSDRQTVDDFLSTIPLDSVAKEAVVRLSRLLAVISQPTAAPMRQSDPETALAWAAFRSYCLALEDDFRRHAGAFHSFNDDRPDKY